MDAHAELDAPHATAGSGARVLVVDASAQSVASLEEVLVFQGYEVEAANTGEQLASTAVPSASTNPAQWSSFTLRTVPAWVRADFDARSAARIGRRHEVLGAS